MARTPRSARARTPVRWASAGVAVAAIVGLPACGSDSRNARWSDQPRSSIKYSTHSSSPAESLIFGEWSSTPGIGGFRPREKAETALRFVRIVLISPLWQVYRNGWARVQFGSVFVEYRW